jgi:Regulator of competence-specific genes
MDRDFLIDLFAGFGLVTIRRMFSGFGISADGTNFALALRGGLYLRADEHSIARFEAEGSKPFQYRTRARTVTINSYWQLPERLYDDPEELADWARRGIGCCAARSPTKASPGNQGGEEAGDKRHLVQERPATKPELTQRKKFSA